MTIDEIIADHVLDTTFNKWDMPADETPVGIPGTEIKVCNSDNHYFDMALVPEDQCHVRQLIAFLPQEIFDNNKLREVEIAARGLLEAIDEGWGGERMDEVVEILRDALGTGYTGWFFGGEKNE